MQSKSSRNAATHGIHTSVIVLRNENNQDFLSLEAELNALWNPVGPLERVLYDEMISADWRLRRTWQNETAAIDLQMDRDAPALAKELHEFDEPVRAAVALTAYLGRQPLPRQHASLRDPLHQADRSRRRPPAVHPGKAPPAQLATPIHAVRYNETAKRSGQRGRG